MKADIKRKWLKALRSGKYKQGRGVLRDEENRFCCLGVLMDITSHSSWTKSTEPDYWGPAYYRHKADAGSGGIPSRAYCRRLGIFSIIKSGDIRVVNELVDMNDKGKSFKIIANWIEKNL